LPDNHSNSFSVRNLLYTPAVLFTHDRGTGSLCAHCNKSRAAY
jgi:hypothetical protein